MFVVGPVVSTVQSRVTGTYVAERVVRTNAEVVEALADRVVLGRRAGTETCAISVALVTGCAPGEELEVDRGLVEVVPEGPCEMFVVGPVV